MDLYTVLGFIRYRLFSRHGKGYGIHSPFLFDLVTEVFRNNPDQGVVNTVETIRKKMISDHGMITVNDLGSGSGRMKERQRMTSDIARFSAVPEKYGIFLSKMAKAFGKPAILEFGTSLGISAMYMAAACPGLLVYTIEGCSETSAIASANFREAGLTNVRLITASFDDALHLLRKEKVVPGLVFIDGDHRKEPLLRYFNFIAGIAENNTVVIIDDIHSGEEMADAWKSIKSHPAVTASVDLFRMGLVFFRKGVSRVSCVIRY
jgi:predicted O-methyltransferase YrrM